MTLPNGYVPVAKFEDCQTISNKYRHYRLSFHDKTFCNRVFIEAPPPNYRLVCPECAVQARWLRKVRPEGKVDTLAALYGRYVGPLTGRR